MNFKRFILGANAVETESQNRKITLGAYLIVISIGVDLFFFIVNLFNPEGEPTSLFVGFLISVICILLLRWRQVNLAILLQLIRSNAFAFYFSYLDVDPIQTGSYLFFIPSSLGALAVFGYRERWIGIGFTAVSFVLFLIAIFKPAEFSPDQAHFYLIVSFSIVLIIGLLIIIFFDRMVTKSERTLVEKNKELIKANRELDRFVYSASHDLRSPLSAIAGLIELIKRDASGSEEYLNLMKNRVLVMDKLIHDIIDYSRNSRVPAAREKVNLYDLMHEVVELLKYADEKNPQINLMVDKDFIIFTDPSRLRVVLNNLLSNALKYADHDKEVLIITINASRSNNSFSFSIEDNGIGIGKEHQDKIFGMFYRASDKATGSGLGLYIVKESLEKLNGVVQCRSKVGIGSVFTVFIPDVI